MRENRTYGSEGGAARVITGRAYPYPGSRHGEGAMRSGRPCCVAGPRAFRRLPTYTGQPPCNREKGEVHVAAQGGLNRGPGRRIQDDPKAFAPPVLCNRQGRSPPVSVIPVVASPICALLNSWLSRESRPHPP